MKQIWLSHTVPFVQVALESQTNIIVLQSYRHRIKRVPLSTMIILRLRCLFSVGEFVKMTKRGSLVAPLCTMWHRFLPNLERGTPICWRQINQPEVTMSPWWNNILETNSLTRGDCISLIEQYTNWSWLDYIAAHRDDTAKTTAMI